MSRKHDSWGIEVGSNAIKAMRLSRAGDEIRLVDYAVLPFKRILTTPDINVDEAIQVNLDMFLSKYDVSGSTVVISVPGHMAFARFAKLPPVEPKKIAEIVTFEAVQQIPFPIEQVEWDYQVFQQEDSPDVEVGIFAITKDRVLTFLNNYHVLNFRVDGLTLSPLAVYNAFAYENEGVHETEGTIYLDIGTVSTDVIIVEGGGIWLRTMPIGGNHFTEALVRAFKLSFPKAEKLKREAGTSKYARQIFQAMRPVFADLVQELQHSLGYYQSRNRDSNLKRLVGVGSTFRLPGLQKFLKQQLQMEVIRPDGFKRITIEGKQEADFAENAMNMSTAYGLALQGLGLETVKANLLPMHIVKSRLWKAKQPWMALTAACLLAASGLAGSRYFSAEASRKSSLDEIDRSYKQVVGQAREYVQRWEEISNTADPRPRIEQLRRILDYRDLWPDILDDITQASNACDPQPALLGVDYEKIRKISPGERRRVYIESIKSQYFSGPGSNLESVEVDVDAETSWEAVARIQIVVDGTTPHDQAAAFLNDHFIRWLKENARRADRPYRITGIDLLHLEQVSSRSTESTYMSLTPGSRSTTPGRRATTTRGLDRGTTSRQERQSSLQSSQYEELIGEHPLKTEEGRSDMHFTIQWTLELADPETARNREQYGRPDDSEQAYDSEVQAGGGKDDKEFWS